MRIRPGILWPFVIILSLVVFSVCAEKAPPYTNSIGMKMMLIPDGTFIMGEQQRISTQEYDFASYLESGDWDEKPLHQVTISNPFYISETEITIALFEKYSRV
jgi:formylglycine-generating enzyme required for sulfatase activity